MIYISTYLFWSKVMYYFYNSIKSFVILSFKILYLHSYSFNQLRFLFRFQFIYSMNEPQIYRALNIKKLNQLS